MEVGTSSSVSSVPLFSGSSVALALLSMIGFGGTFATPAELFATITFYSSLTFTLPHDPFALACLKVKTVTCP